MKRGKKLINALQEVDRSQLYSPLEAVRLAKKLSFSQFDETIEVHIRLGVDPRQANQQVRGTVVLPHGTGKQIRVAVFAQGEKAKEAQEAGADIVGADDLVEQVQKGEINFDAAVATPDMMSKVGKVGKILGPRGLMPNPKTGTVTFEVGKAVKDIKAGKIEYRLDKYGIVHLVIGKVSFNEKALVENYATVIDELIKAKPAAAKGRYLKSITISTTMGPGIKVDPLKTRNLLEEAVAV